MKMQTIENQRFGTERALYRSENLKVKGCRFEGEEDGESALKESRNIVAESCFMDLRYPFWHVDKLRITGCELTKNCRAAMWYDNGVRIENSTLNGIKALRECRDVILKKSAADSPEFLWRCKNIAVEDSTITSQYGFWECKNVRADKLTFSGKYAFQYTENVKIARSKLTAKDGFWHAKNVTVTDSVIEGEYLGWYSQNLTLVRCHIKGTQPLCYCKGLRLIDCTMEDCDLSFEYSDVRADVKGDIVSVKNPTRGKITADGYGQIILENSVYSLKAKIIKRQ